MSRNQIRGTTARAIAASVERALQAGRLGTSDRLPPIRELAASLGVSPVTVAAAYRVLRSRGLAAGHGRRGTVLHPSANAPPVPAGRRRARAGLVDLATGNPDPALLPPIGRALHAVSAEPRLFGGMAELPALASFAAAEFEADGIPPGPVAVTSGGLDAIERVLREHLRVGDCVAVEDPTSPALLDLLASRGLVPAPVSIDDEGLVPGSLARVLGTTVRGVVLSPRAQNPTGAALSAGRVADLSRVLRSHPETLVIEVDDASAVSGAQAFTLSRGRQHWVVVRSTSRFLGPDLRVAVITGDEVTIERVRRRQAVGERWVSHVLQSLAAALWSDPSSGRHLARAADLYTERRRALVDSLAAHGIVGSGRSGFHVWVPVREEAATVQDLADCGWAVAAGERFRLRSAPAIRITASALLPAEALRLAADLAASLRRSRAAPA